MTKMKIYEVENIWDAIEDTPEEAQNMKLRSVLMMELEKTIKDRGLTQAQAAKLLGVTQPRVSALMRGKINLFGLDALINMAVAMGLRVDLHVHEPQVAPQELLLHKRKNADARTLHA